LNCDQAFWNTPWTYPSPFTKAMTGTNNVLAYLQPYQPFTAVMIIYTYLT